MSVDSPDPAGQWGAFLAMFGWTIKISMRFARKKTNFYTWTWDSRGHTVDDAPRAHSNTAVTVGTAGRLTAGSTRSHSTSSQRPLRPQWDGRGRPSPSPAPARVQIPTRAQSTTIRAGRAGRGQGRGGVGGGGGVWRAGVCECEARGGVCGCVGARVGTRVRELCASRRDLGAISARSRRDLGAISVHLDVLEVLLGNLQLLVVVLTHL